MRDTPIPNAPPRYERADEAAGLAILELAIRMEHVPRVSENLCLLNRTHMQRSVLLDVDLRALATRQKKALHARDESVVKAGAEHASATAREMRTPEAGVWIPVARLNRVDLAPVIMRDATGAVAPRLTTEAVTRVLSAGLSRLLKLMLASQAIEDAAPRPDLPTPREQRATLDPQARWLIERAMAAMIASGVVDSPGGRPASPDCQADSTDEFTNRIVRVRRQAEAYLDDLERKEPARAAELGYLLDVASTEQFLVVRLPVDIAQHQLSYDAPPVPEKSPGRKFIARFVARTVHGYRVSYATQIPRGISSFHVTIEVPEELRTREFLLTTAASQPAVLGLADDLEFLAKVAETPAGPRSPVFLADLNDVMARAASLIRIRLGQAARYTSSFVVPSPARGPVQASDLLDLWRQFDGGKATLSALTILVLAQENGTLETRLEELDAVDLGGLLRAISR